MIEYTQEERDRIGKAAGRFDGHVTNGSLNAIVAEIYTIDKERWAEFTGANRPRTLQFYDSVPQGDGTPVARLSTKLGTRCKGAVEMAVIRRLIRRLGYNLRWVIEWLEDQRRCKWCGKAEPREYEHTLCRSLLRTFGRRL